MYQQPVPQAPKAKGSDGAVLTFAILLFVTVGILAVLQLISFSKTVRIIYGIIAILQACSFLLIPFGIKKGGIKAFAFILIFLVVAWWILHYLGYFGINIF